MNAPSDYTVATGVGAVVLAAGESARMGRPKQLIEHRGRTLLRHAIDAALGANLSPVVVILGAHSEAIAAHIKGLPVVATQNPDWRDGMGSSLRAGLVALLAAQPETAAAVFLVCDQPELSPQLLTALIHARRRTGRSIVASQYGDSIGVPALFARSHFPELLTLSGDEGARKVILRHRAAVEPVAFPGGGTDVDTPADLALLSAS